MPDNVPTRSFEYSIQQLDELFKNIRISMYPLMASYHQLSKPAPPEWEKMVDIADVQLMKLIEYSARFGMGTFGKDTL